MNHERPSLRLAILLPSFLALCGTIAFAGLLGLGRWQIDEFHTGTQFREEGLSALYTRITTWSPRIFSEILLYLYHAAVTAADNRLIPVFYAGLWLFLILLALAPLKLLSSHQRWLGLAFLASLLFLCVAGQQNGEVFYWLQSSFAYMPTLACVLFVAGVALLDGFKNSRWVAACSAALVVAALSSETGAFFAGPFAALMLVFGNFAVSRGEASRVVRRCSFAPILASAVVAYLLLNGRFGNSGEVFGDPTVAHNFWLATQGSVLLFAKDAVLFGDNVLGGRMPWMGALAKLAFLIGATSFFVRTDANKSGILLPIAVLGCAVFAGWFTIFGGFYQFGGHCCGRHATMEQAYIWIALAALARVAATFVPPAIKGADAIAAVALAMSVAVPLLLLSPKLVRDYLRYEEIVEAQSRPWVTGRDSSPEINFPRFTRGEIVQGGNDFIAPGTYERKSDTSWYPQLVMDYFGKDKLIVSPE